MIKNIVWNWLHFGYLQCPYPGLYFLCSIWVRKHSQSLKCNHFWNFAFLSRQGIKCGGSDNNDEDGLDHDDNDTDKDENNGNGKNHDDNGDQSNNNNNNNNCKLKINIPSYYTS